MGKSRIRNRPGAIVRGCGGGQTVKDCGQSSQDTEGRRREDAGGFGGRTHAADVGTRAGPCFRVLLSGVGVLGSMVGLRAAAVVAQVVATHAGCVAKLPGGGTQE